jgi:uncharacterized protein (DUF1697 family)
VALLRAVNVGGTQKLSMAAWREMLEELGYQRVETYIQSGNAVFDAKGTRAAVGAAIAAGLEKLMGAKVGVVLRTHEELGKIIEENPYVAEAAETGGKVHVVFLSDTPTAEAAAGLEKIVISYPKRRDRYTVKGHTLYLHLPEGAGETKFQAKTVDRILGCMGTARNWNTVLKLHAMSKRS